MYEGVIENNFLDHFEADGKLWSILKRKIDGSTVSKNGSQYYDTVVCSYDGKELDFRLCNESSIKHLSPFFDTDFVPTFYKVIDFFSYEFKEEEIIGNTADEILLLNPECIFCICEKNHYEPIFYIVNGRVVAYSHDKVNGDCLLMTKEMYEKMKNEHADF